MKTAITIVQSIILANFEKDATFDIKKTGVQFWQGFTNDFVRFDQDTKPVEAHIERLGLTNAQKIIDKLPHLHTQLLKELAECYVLGQTMPETNELLNSKNPFFLKEVQFLQTMQQAIKSVERKRIKTALPTAYERLTFELSDTDLANAIKKKGREDLKNKFKQWDAELAQEPTPIETTLTQDKKETKIISLSWVRYASIAAIFMIGFMVWQPNKLSNEKLFFQYNSDESIVQSIEYEKLVTISESEGVRGGEFLFPNFSKYETDKAMESIELFRNNNFEKSKHILITLNPKGRNNQLLLFLAISQLKTNEVDLAVSNLKYLDTLPNYQFLDDVKFYLALGYINQNEKNKAKDLFAILVSKNNKYSKASQEILDNIRWF